MPSYLVGIYRPGGYDPARAEDVAMLHGIDNLNREMVAAGVRQFAGGLQSPDRATSLRWTPEGELIQDNAVFLRTDMYLGGFWILNVADQAEAIAWGRKAARACRAGVEVRPLHD
ncbi:MAG: hypothetical protein H6993_13310 [Pseudomonadales bacterium]|nr:hypothetical protein [Pseudomonadales bacterium]MCP5184938.1 hypothetical protein [Pseudomonadales bacterium]